MANDTLDKIGEWFSKKAKDVSNSIAESNIENAYDEAHDHYLLYSYSKNSLLETSKSLYGELDGLVLTYYGTEVYDLYSIIIDEKTGQAYFSVKYDEDTSVEVAYNGSKYIRPAKRLILSKEAREVKVIKVKDKFYLYEKPEN